MRYELRPDVRLTAGLVVLALLPMGTPCFAEERSPKSLATSAALHVASMDTAAATQTPPAPGDQTAAPKSFFSTKKGVLAALAMAGVLAFTIDSRLTNHIQSPGRK